MNQKFDRIVTLLKEIFQLDQPDLDFGLYRIMHAKSGEVTQFLGRDLLAQVRDAFSQYQAADRAALHNHAVEQAKSEGGVCGLRLYVEKDNVRAKWTYEKLGMKKTEYELYEVELKESMQ